MKRNTKFILTTGLIILVLVTVFAAAMAFILASPRSVAPQNTPTPVMEVSIRDTQF